MARLAWGGRPGTGDGFGAALRAALSPDALAPGTRRRWLWALLAAGLVVRTVLSVGPALDRAGWKEIDYLMVMRSLGEHFDPLHPQVTWPAEGTRVTAMEPLRVGPRVLMGDRAAVNGMVGADSCLGDDVNLHDTPTLGNAVVFGRGSTAIGPVSILDFTRVGEDSFIGEGGSFGPFARIGNRVGLPRGSSVGAWSVVGDDFSANSTCSIGDVVVIGPRVTFFDVQVGDFVLIGRDTSIRRGIDIGSHSVIGYGVTIDLLDVDFPPGTFIPSGTSLP